MYFHFRFTAYMLENAESRKENLLFMFDQDGSDSAELDHDKKYEINVFPSISIYF